MASAAFGKNPSQCANWSRTLAGHCPEPSQPTSANTSAPRSRERCTQLSAESIRAASTKPFGFQAFYPGPGVGGHCIPIDPNYLSHRVRAKLKHTFRFVELAQDINAQMPNYVVSRAAELLNDHAKAVRGSTVLLLGVTYKSDIADQRESPAVDVARAFEHKGAQVSFHDPYVSTWRHNGAALTRVEDLDAAIRAADLVVLLQAHRAYDVDALAQEASLVFDTRGRAADAPNVARL